MKDFYGYNSFFRVRCLDGIPFNQQLKFDFELLGWENGTVDYSSTVFWYGDLSSQAVGSSGIEEIEAGLLPTPTQSPVCSIANAIDFAKSNQPPNLKGCVMTDKGSADIRASGI